MKKMDDQQLIEHLESMPIVQDRLSEEDWKQRVQPGAYKLQRQKRKRLKMIPLLSTALMIGILILIIPSLFQNQPSTLEQSATRSMMDMESKGPSDLTTDQAKEGESYVTNEHTVDEARGTYVLYDVGDQEWLVYAGTFDQSVQYIIPLTFVTTHATSVTDAYNQVDRYINDFSETSSVPYFKEVTFDIKEDDGEVIMNIPEDYSIGEGSAIQGKFEEMLTIMFAPYDITKIIFNHPSNEPVSLGEIGEYRELELNEPKQANFKIYDDQASENEHLVPIDQGDVSFPDAIKDLKHGDGDFFIEQTISSDVDLSITCENDHTCTINFLAGTDNMTEEEVVVAIESMLMTAKSYGYGYLQFNGLPYETIAGYDFSEQISVPLAVNPIHISE